MGGISSSPDSHKEQKYLLPIASSSPNCTSYFHYDAQLEEMGGGGGKQEQWKEEVR